MKCVGETDPDIVYTSYDYIDGNNVSYANAFIVPTSIEYTELLKQNVMSCSGIMIKKIWMQKYTKNC